MRLVLVAVLCSLLAGCATRSVAPEVVVVPEAPHMSAAPRAHVRRPASSVSTLYFVREDRLWRFDVADGEASSMGVAVTCPGSGEVDVGSDRPLLSPSRRFIAHLSSDGLYLTDTQTAESRPVTYPGKPAPGHDTDLRILLSGWSPDGRYFIFHVGHGGDGMQVEKAPMTESGEALGFELLDSSDFSVRRLAGLESFVAWAPDSRRVVVEAASPSGKPALYYVDPDKGNRGLVREARSGSHFWQLRISGEQAAWMDGRHVAAAALSSGEPESITSDGEFADFQWPSLSPDGKHLAYLHRIRTVQGWPISGLMVVDRTGANPHSLRECRGSCPYQWSDADRLVLEVEKEGIFYLDLAGNAVAIAGPDSTAVFVGQD